MSNSDVTRHEVPALRRPPLDERLPRLNCAPQPIAWEPAHDNEKTLIEGPSEDAAARDAKRARVPLDRWLLLALALATLGYCTSTTLQHRARGGTLTGRAALEIVIVVTTEDQVPVPGAGIALDDGTTGTTDAQGEWRLTSSRAEGSTVALMLRCPAGYAGNNAPVRLALRRFVTLEGSTSAPPRQRLTCNVMTRSALLLVSAGEPNIPILVNGAPRAVTDASGTAQLRLQGGPTTELQVTLDTSSRPELRPQQPSQTFTLGQTAEFFTFQQPLESEKMTKGRVTKRKQTNAPYRME
jgi:hypothetical protein